MATLHEKVPQPGQAKTEAEFVASMRALKDWSRLTYRQLAERAESHGDVLPHSTLANALARSTLPRQELVAALVRACGCGEDTVEVWLAAHRRIAAGPAPSDGLSESAPEASSAPSASSAPPPSRPRPSYAALVRFARTRTGKSAGVALGVVLAAVLAVGIGLAFFTDEGGRSADAVRRPPEGKVTIRAAHSGLCVTEGRERNGRTDRALAVQQDCEKANSAPPVTLLERVDEGIYRIQWSHPEHGLGCLTVDEGGTGNGYLLAPQACEEDQPQQRFLMEAVDTPVADGYRLRPMNSGKCVGFVDPAMAKGAELVQSSCTGSTEQEFFIEAGRLRTPAPGASIPG
ncbi:helix-turn-helix domain-containing protein [Streptomyces scopuliridis]|uniref:helix-turn-helix domain-containing protein n=1 Tax=Streptomyces scopuliridis TaxID=452529 RepID=UPI0036C4ADE5